VKPSREEQPGLANHSVISRTTVHVAGYREDPHGLCGRRAREFANPDTGVVFVESGWCQHRE
jgi:hypothetical protein